MSCAEGSLLIGKELAARMWDGENLKHSYFNKSFEPKEMDQFGLKEELGHQSSKHTVQKIVMLQTLFRSKPTSPISAVNSQHVS